MNMERFLPTAPLRPFIKHFLFIESETGMETKVLPDTAVVMSFRYRGQVTDVGDEAALPTAALSGLRKSARHLMYDRATANLLVVFREGGPAAFFRDPLHELFQVSLSLDDWLRPQPLRETTERLVEAKDNRQRIGIIERFLLSERKEIEADRLVLQAVQAIKEAHGQLKIKALLTDLPLSRDPFEKRFRRVVGTSPKQYATIVRFRTLIAGYRPVDSLTTVAHRAGYFDQAHFIKDFKSFTGKSPKDFFAADSYW